MDKALQGVTEWINGSTGQRGKGTTGPGAKRTTGQRDNGVKGHQNKYQV